MMDSASRRTPITRARGPELLERLAEGYIPDNPSVAGSSPASALKELPGSSRVGGFFRGRATGGSGSRCPRAPATHDASLPGRPAPAERRPRDATCNRALYDALHAEFDGPAPGPR